MVETGRKHEGSGASTLSAAVRDELLRRPLTDDMKGLPIPGEGTTVADIAGIGWSLGSGLVPPVAVLRRSAILNNVDLMASYCAAHDLQLAPHVKTTMAPQLISLQMAGGAWGVTAATAFHTRILADCGIGRILIAHQVIDRSALDELIGVLERHPHIELFVLADSIAGVRLMQEALDASATATPVNVLVELGIPGGRTGCRRVDEVLDVARAVVASRSLRLAGIEGYEGLIDEGSLDATIEAIDYFLDRMVEAAILARAEGLFDDRPLLSAGGSAYFDRVAERFAAAGSDFVKVVRSGCYIAHDHGKYRRLSPLDGRSPGGPRLQPALEVWAAVVSLPEPGSAVLNAGRRDVSFDAGLPVAVKRLSRGSDVVEDLEHEWEVMRLMDQHAVIHVPPGQDLELGDLIGLGISHPCTTFDKWKLIPVVDDRYHVIDGIVTLF